MKSLARSIGCRRASGRLAGALALAVLWLTQPPALACRYNVRDLGFIEVPSEHYSLIRIADPAPAPDDLARQQSELERLLLDTNLRGEILAKDAVAEDSRAPVLDPFVKADGPGWFLLSADGFGTGLIDLTGQPAVGGEEPPRLGALLGSRLTRQLADTCARSFGAILLIDGDDEARNSSARQTILAAIQEISDGMADLPKAVVAPPELVTLPAARVAEEKVVLWSMGLPAETAEAPRAAVFYGTARWIGPLMEGTHITAENLTRLFWIIGADCECGMDLAWTRGTPLPLRWTEELHATAAKSLGFDPASPMVRAEALRIINRYSRGEFGDAYAARAQASSTPPEPAVAATKADAPAVEAEAGSAGNATSAVIPPATAGQRTDASPAQSPGGRVLLVLTLIGLVLLLGVMLALLIVFHRVGRRAERAARQRNAKR